MKRTWEEDILLAYQKLGGCATFDEIYKAVIVARAITENNAFLQFGQVPPNHKEVKRHLANLRHKEYICDDGNGKDCLTDKGKLHAAALTA